MAKILPTVLSAENSLLAQDRVGRLECQLPADSMIFLPALLEYLDDYRVHYAMDVQFETKGGGEAVLEGSAQVQVMRIVQETLNNVRKHARTNKARICIERNNAHIRISVQDDGQGFDPASVMGRDRQYVGLQVMRERAESIGGTLTLESQPGKGTTVVLEVPIASNRG